MLLVIACIVLAVLIFISIWWFGKTKCPDCRKRKCENIFKKKLKTETIYFKEKEIIQNYKNTTGHFPTPTQPPNTFSTRMVLIPGERIWYLVKYKCNNCGKVFFRKEYIDKRPIIK